MATLPL